MRLGFEKWYQEKITNDQAKELFNESCLCYKVGAYRASFLMTYLGFQNILKDRLLKATACPQGTAQTLWEKIQKNLLDDKKWDEEVFESVNRIQPSNIFLISDDIRKQYQYFRCIRNDCAHAKSNNISYPHVESLWLFIESNYNRFVVNGGRNGLLERIRIHYNPIYTKPNSDISLIIEDINSSMDVREIPEFLKDVYDFFKSNFYILNFKDEEVFGFWSKIVYSTNEDLRKSIIIFAKEDWDVFLNFIDSYPDKLMEIFESSTNEFRREFWNEKIFKMFSWSYDNGWHILKSILENNIIPEDELNDFIEKLSNKVGKVPPKEHIEFFNSVQYLEKLKGKYFGSTRNFNPPNGIDYANNNWEKIKHLIINIGLDYNVVSQLNGAFSAASYGTFYNGMKLLLRDNKEFRNKYKDILVANDSLIPQYILDLEESE